MVPFLPDVGPVVGDLTPEEMGPHPRAPGVVTWTFAANRPGGRWRRRQRLGLARVAPSGAARARGVCEGPACVDLFKRPAVR